MWWSVVEREAVAGTPPEGMNKPCGKPALVVFVAAPMRKLLEA